MIKQFEYQLHNSLANGDLIGACITLLFFCHWRWYNSLITCAIVFCAFFVFFLFDYQPFYSEAITRLIATRAKESKRKESPLRSLSQKKIKKIS